MHFSVLDSWIKQKNLPDFFHNIRYIPLKRPVFNPKSRCDTKFHSRKLNENWRNHNNNRAVIEYNINYLCLDIFCYFIQYTSMTPPSTWADVIYDYPMRLRFIIIFILWSCFCLYTFRARSWRISNDNNTLRLWKIYSNNIIL